MASKDDTLQKIDADLIWRKRELTSIKSIIDHSTEGNAPAIIRASICLLYSHWEGFIKCAGTHYLQYVCNQGKSASELKGNFVAIKFLSQLQEAAKSSKPSVVGGVVDFISSKWNDRLRINHKNVIDTQSNLSSSRLKEILWIIGIETTSFETKSTLIDSSLVARRNNIAHGQPLDINTVEYHELHFEVMNLLEIYRTELQNSLINSSYLR